MISDDEINKAIDDVVNKYSESEWVVEIKRRIPDADDGLIMSYIEIYFGGDVVAVDD